MLTILLIVLNVTVELFADDTKLYTVITKDDDNCAQLQHSLDSIASWAEHWQLKLSPKKCAVMHITPRPIILLDASHYLLLINLLILESAMIIVYVFLVISIKLFLKLPIGRDLY
jgi:Reverse transcriptase (RNA-dependent DNA polymerase)